MIDELKLVEKKATLVKNEIHLMTELMAYLVQLKVSNRGRYQLIKKIILSQVNTPKGIPEKEELQMSLSHIFSLHRGCSKSEGEDYCQHLRELMNYTIKLLS